MKKILSIVLCLVLSVNVFIVAAPVTKKTVHAATTNQKNIVARADYMYNSTWVCKKTISGWNYKYTFYEGNTYHLPYAWPVHAGAYIGFGISVEDFLKAAANPNHSFYKYRSYVSGVSYSYSTYYGSDCSSFVSWCWGIKRNTTYTIPNFSTYIGGVSTYNATNVLQLGDALNSQDHVVLVTDLEYSSTGAITRIEITEQTPPQMKRSYYTPAALSAKYGGSYSIYRYYGTVPEAPGYKPTLPDSPVNIGSGFTATISNINANMNVAVEDNGNVVIRDKANNSAQQWKFTRRDNGSYEIKNVKTGKCLDVDASSSSAGANIHVWDDYDNPAQSWYIYYVNGNYVLRPGCSNSTVLDVAGSGTTSGTNVATWTFNDCDAQKFQISHVVPTESVDLGDKFVAKITNASSNKNLSIYEPNNVVIYHDSTSPAQQWRFVRQSDGSYEITNIKYNKCLDVSEGSSKPGTNVQLWDDIDSKAQRWFIYSVGDKYILRPACSFDTVLDVEGGFADDNTNVHTWNYISSDAQLFKINKLYDSNGYEAGYTGGMAGDGKIYAHGLDLSSWQGTGVDFNAIKNAGYSYVILRAGTSKGRDTCFDTLYANAKAAGLDVGAYYYSYATDVATAKKDAENMLTWVQGKLFEYPLYFDYEDASQNNLSATTSKNICLTFMDQVANAGYLVGMYTGYYKSTTYPMSEICAKYEVWIANYYDYTYQTLSPQYSSKYGMYQYTDRNYIGNAGPYDGNVVFKDYPSIVKKYGFNGYTASKIEELPKNHVNLGSDFYATITNVGAGKNLSIYEPNNVVIYQQSGSDAQKWHFVLQDDGSYEITNVKYNKCLDVEGGIGNAGDNVEIWDDLNNSAQRWYILPLGNSYVLRPACSDYAVLDVAGSATANDSNIHIWTFNGCNAQKFTINQILPTEVVNLGDKFTAKITSTFSSKNLSIYEPENVIIYQNSISPAQQWNFVRQKDGSYEITNKKYNKCLDVEGGIGNSGDNVQIWDDLDNDAQRWFIYNINGHYVLRPACSQTSVLDVFNVEDKDGTNVQIWTYHGGDAQLFDINKVSEKDYINLGDTFFAKVTNVNSDKNLSVNDNTNVVIYTQNDKDSQQWKFVRCSDGSYNIINLDNGKYLEVADGSANAGANVRLGAKTGAKAQSWYIYAVNNGQYIIKPACTVDCVLDVAGSGINDNDNVATWTYNACGAQLFTINKINVEYDKTLNGLYKSTDGNYYYYVKGVIDTKYTGMYKHEGKWLYINKGKYDTSYTGMAKNAYGWWYMKNGQLDKTYTGMAKNEYGWWYMANGKLDKTYTGMIQNGNELWYVKAGAFDSTLTGMYKHESKWIYVNAGKYDKTYTGMAKNEYGWWYMKNGEYDKTYTGMAKNQYGWWYMTNGKLDKTYTGMAKNQYGWWYMTNGKLDKTYTGMMQNGNELWYVKAGAFDSTFTGMYKHESKWIYVNAGKYDKTYTGMAKNQYGWWYMKNGEYDKTYTGMAKNQYGWWYMTNGKLDKTYTGMAKNQNGWWYMTNGKLDKTYTGMAKNQNGWWYMTKGEFDSTYTGLAKNEYGTWYMQEGYLDRTFSGKVTIGGVKYNIVNGMVK